MIYCTTCKHKTVHERVTHHGGEKLWRCATCWTTTLAKQPVRGLRKNPRAVSVRDVVKNDNELRKGAKLYNDFTGHAPTKIQRVRVPKTSGKRVAIGPVTAIMYLARDGEKLVHYIHRFKRGSRPSLTVTPDGKRIELLGGAFRFTDRGIVDK